MRERFPKRSCDTDLDALEPLKALTNLQELDLFSNPVTDTEGYRCVGSVGVPRQIPIGWVAALCCIGALWTPFTDPLGNAVRKFTAALALNISAACTRSIDFKSYPGIRTTRRGLWW